ARLLGTAEVAELRTALLLRAVPGLVAALRPAAEPVPRASLVPAAITFGFVAEVAVLGYATAGTRMRPVLAARLGTVAVVAWPSGTRIGEVAGFRLLPGVPGLALAPRRVSRLVVFAVVAESFTSIAIAAL